MKLKRILIVAICLILPTAIGSYKMSGGGFPGVSGDGANGLIVEGSVAIGGTNPLSVDVDGDGDADFILATTAPASATAAGTAGQVFFADDFIYVCITTGADGAAAWVRCAIATWP